MNTHSEKGLQAWLESDLTNPPAVHTGLTAEEIPPEDQIISCYVERSQRAAGPLYRFFAKVIVSTPPHEGDDPEAALEKHRAVVAAVRTLLASPDNTNVQPLFDAASGLFWKGGFHQGELEGVDSGRWITTLDFIGGISTAPDS